MNEQRIEEVAARAAIKLKELGLSDGTVSLKRDRHYKYVIEFFHEHGILEYDDAILSSFIKMVNNKEGKPWSHHYCNDLKRAALQLRECYNTGTLVFHTNQGKKKFNPSFQFLKVLNQAVASTKLKLEFRHKIVGILRRFCCWVEDQGANSLCALTKEHIFNYLQNNNGKRTRGTVSYDIYAIRLLLKYLEENQICEVNFDPSILLPAKTGRRHIEPFSKDDVKKILGAINKTSISGKRNYAILLLSITTGIRAGDIVKLKLADIDWNKYEISFEQGKTSRNLVVPLEPITGNAIGEYILSARPKSSLPYIFLTILAPFRGLKGGSALDSMLTKYCKQAGVQQKTWQSFHSLRRSLGTWMVNSGVAIFTVSQVLGHTNLKSTDRYITADMRIVNCALDFSGILVESEVLR